MITYMLIPRIKVLHMFLNQQNSYLLISLQLLTNFFKEIDKYLEAQK